MPFCPMTRSLHPRITACGHRVRFAGTWREEFFEAPNYLPDRTAMRTAVAAITKRASARSSARREHGRGDTCPEKALSSQCALWMPIGDTSRRKALRHQRTAWTVLDRGGVLADQGSRD